jgi:hypothetical protein
MVSNPTFFKSLFKHFSTHFTENFGQVLDGGENKADTLPWDAHPPFAVTTYERTNICLPGVSMLSQRFGKTLVVIVKGISVNIRFGNVKTTYPYQVAISPKPLHSKELIVVRIKNTRYLHSYMLRLSYVSPLFFYYIWKGLKPKTYQHPKIRREPLMCLDRIMGRRSSLFNSLLPHYNCIGFIPFKV